MKALVIYDSVFGNTAIIARAIFDSLRTRSDAALLKPDQVSAGQLEGLDLLVVGSPTRGFRPTEGITAFLKQLPPKSLKGMKTAAFDTRFSVDDLDTAWMRFLVSTGGYAAKRIADALKKAGGSLVALPEGFYVKDIEGPLMPGELERAASWAASLIDAL